MRDLGDIRIRRWWCGNGRSHGRGLWWCGVGADLQVRQGLRRGGHDRGRRRLILGLCHKRRRRRWRWRFLSRWRDGWRRRRAFLGRGDFDRRRGGCFIDHWRNRCVRFSRARLWRRAGAHLFEFLARDHGHVHRVKPQRLRPEPPADNQPEDQAGVTCDGYDGAGRCHGLSVSAARRGGRDIGDKPDVGKTPGIQKAHDLRDLIP